MSTARLFLVCWIAASLVLAPVGGPVAMMAGPADCPDGGDPGAHAAEVDRALALVGSDIAAGAAADSAHCCELPTGHCAHCPCANVGSNATGLRVFPGPLPSFRVERLPEARAGTLLRPPNDG